MRAVRLPVEPLNEAHAHVMALVVELLVTAGRTDEQARELAQAASPRLRAPLGNLALAVNEHIKRELGLERLT